MFTKLDPYENIKFTKKHIEIKNKEGEAIFDEDIEFPDNFDDSHATIVASRYLCNNAKRKETSLKDMVDRVSDQITEWAEKGDYFDSKEELADFNFKLKYYQINGYFAFNSPVYFNVGLTDKPQTSACFILSIEDNMESIFDLAKIESQIFKHGSGSGVNMSTLRSSKERVSRGGFASGPISFLKAHDTVAGVIKSGGTLRRSAKLVCLDDYHPDIEEFICCKDKEEDKLRAIANAGIKPDTGYDLSDEVFYQNTNISVRLSDRFMTAIEKDDYWELKYINSPGIYKQLKARQLLWKIAEHAWKTGDPGVQFSDTFNKWNTVLNDGEIKSTNPCGEFAFINNSSCNLASINLLKFFPDKATFDYETFVDVVETMIIAQDVLIDNSGYPTEFIKENSINYRPLGAGYTNLGATLMYLGLPYNSEEGRTLAALLTAFETGIAYATSNKLANKLESFKYFDRNRSSFYRVLNQHIEAVNNLLKTKNSIMTNIELQVKNVWDRIAAMIQSGESFRNSTVTLLAPTGTISSLMQAATTGIEPEFSLVRYKTLSNSGGSVLKFVNPVVESALKNLDYSGDQIISIIEHIKEFGCLDKCKHIKKEHLPIFDTSIAPKGSSRVIDYMGHVKMCAAVQPFLSMAISKTINMPNLATVEDVYNLYLTAWKMGLKGITIYRDGSKSFQPLTAETTKETEKKVEIETETKLKRKKLPDDRPAHRHKFRVGNVEGYLAPGFYKNGELGEIFIDLTKEGSTLSGFADALATIVSISLQYGIPLKDFVKKMMFLRFEPAGFTSNPEIRTCTSIVDYIFRYLGLHYLPEQEKQELGLVTKKELSNDNYNKITKELAIKADDAAPTCPECGSFMRLLGTCWTCVNCAWNEGSCG